MPAILILVAIALLVEVFVVIRCAVRGVALGRAFGVSILFQFIFGPVLVFLYFVMWDVLFPISPDVEPLGPRFERQWNFLAAEIWVVVVSTIVAACLAAPRFFARPKSREKEDLNK